MKIIGRKREHALLNQCLASDRPEFAVVYGRRRIGKTYLIKNYFNNRFAFYATGLSDEKTTGQLRAFNESLNMYGSTEKKAPADCLCSVLKQKQINPYTLHSAVPPA